MILIGVVAGVVIAVAISSNPHNDARPRIVVSPDERVRNPTPSGGTCHNDEHPRPPERSGVFGRCYWLVTF
jgi:hypothetical protein